MIPMFRTRRAAPRESGTPPSSLDLCRLQQPSLSSLLSPTERDSRTSNIGPQAFSSHTFLFPHATPAGCPATTGRRTATRRTRMPRPGETRLGEPGFRRRRKPAGARRYRAASERPACCAGPDARDALGTTPGPDLLQRTDHESKASPPVVRERLVRLGHLLQVVLALDGRPIPLLASSSSLPRRSAIVFSRRCRAYPTIQRTASVVA